ncbi:hypothetical protein [Paramagnetospirillum kuznetsovii]|uniref:hypothetical protein n=1 Tax=Paramagnetospirillum kuznetsovii TaxID=2053833 RepID=UPI0013751FF8|nr:hypothetical protein [Paramagnetospirillum kuznetsovii]
MKILTRLGLFSAIALAPVLMDDIHEYLIGRYQISVQVADMDVRMPEMRQIATIQVR